MGKQFGTLLFAAIVAASLMCSAAAVTRNRRQGTPEAQLRNFVNTLPNLPGGSPNVPTASSLTLAELTVLQANIQAIITFDQEVIPNWVQLSFHDCTGPAGCNGCLDVMNPANIGLKETVTLVEFIRRKIAPTLTMADFIALLGTEAAKAGAINGGGSVSLPYSIGRRDCPNKLPDVNLPSGFQIDTIELLTSEFGITTREVVALMGAHSLGRTRPENSGFDGPWDGSETGLSRGYYRVLRSNDLLAEQVNNDKATSTQWKRDGEFLMLHADLILRKNFTTSGEFDIPSCGATDVTQCADQPTAVIVEEFADDVAAFHIDFSSAYLKMISKVSGTNGPLTLVQ